MDMRCLSLAWSMPSLLLSTDRRRILGLHCTWQCGMVKTWKSRRELSTTAFVSRGGQARLPKRRAACRHVRRRITAMITRASPSRLAQGDSDRTAWTGRSHSARGKARAREAPRPVRVTSDALLPPARPCGRTARVA